MRAPTAAPPRPGTAARASCARRALSSWARYKTGERAGALRGSGPQPKRRMMIGEQEGSMEDAREVRIRATWRELVRAGFWLGAGGVFAYELLQAIVGLIAGLASV